MTSIGMAISSLKSHHYDSSTPVTDSRQSKKAGASRPRERYTREEELQHVLDHFNLRGIDTELFDQDYIEGDHYWKEYSLERAVDYKNDKNGTTQQQDAVTVVVPYRVQHFHHQYRNQVQESIRASLDPLSPRSMNPTSIKSSILDTLCEEKSDNGQMAASVHKGFGTQNPLRRDLVGGDGHRDVWIRERNRRRLLQKNALDVEYESLY
jgi:hypothetical protein